MESSFIQERKCISMVFNSFRDSIFLLSYEKDILSLTEEDISRNIILRRFKVLKRFECNVKNYEYKSLPIHTYEGYSLYFWESSSKLILVYPFGYLIIYDYNSGNIEYHFQCHGKKTYVVRNIVGSPIENSLFISAQFMRNVYHIDYDNIKKGNFYQKLRLPTNEAVYDLICHPIEKYIFVACSDGIIRVFDYSDNAKIKQVKNDLIDLDPSSLLKNKNQSDFVQKANLGPVLAMDINTEGTFLLSGNGNGNIYLWDALMALKEKTILHYKFHISYSGILCLKFLKNKQFQNLQRFICLTKEGKFLIYSIILKEQIQKTYEFQTLYENSTFNPIIYPLTKYNVITSNFINISYFNNVISFMWPNLKIEKLRTSGGSESNLLFTSYSAKFFFFYDNDFPKINFPLSTQMNFLSYEDYIPQRKHKTNFLNKLFMIDNFHIYQYELLSGTNKKLINYSKEIGLKNIYPLRFEVVSDNIKGTFFILIANENSEKFTLMLELDFATSVITKNKKFEETIDLALLGESKLSSEFCFMLKKDKQTGLIYNLKNEKTLSVNIDASVIRIYSTPFNLGYCLLYRNVLNELKFSENLTNSTERKFTFKSINDNCYKLDFSEREVDVIFTKYLDKIYCAISMIEKIVITDDKMKTLYSFKISLYENRNIISSLFWVGKTLIYAQGNNISYFYGDDLIDQKMFSNDRPSTYIAGVLSDRMILVNKTTKDIDNLFITTPMINPIEPILIGYLDSTKIDYNLVRECVVNMFTNQISQNLIDKFIKKNLKEVAWLFISDTQSSFQNVKIKIQILNDLLQFDKVLENLITTDLKNEMHLDELIWKFNYDQSVDYIKNLLRNEIIVLINYGQFDKAVKILELLGDYPKTLDILLFSNSKEEFEKLRVLFQAKKCLSYTDNLFINNTFCEQFKQDETNKYNMNHYSKIFDKFQGEHFPFGANQEKFTVNSIKNIENKVNKKTSYITNISKKILTYGEKPYDIYVNAFNKETNDYESKAICSLVLQKIEHFYGTNNTVIESGLNKQKNIRNFNMQDMSLSLSQIQKSVLTTNSALDESSGDINVNDDFNDIDLNGVNYEDISEAIYLSAYYHCDKGNGLIVEDITDNSNNANLVIEKEKQNENLQNNNNNNAQNNNNSEDDELLWSQVLDEFDPLEYEDKWGRKSPGPHNIKFSKKLKTKMVIKSNPSLDHFNKRFTIEMWSKLSGINETILNKDKLNVEIQNGEFKLNYNSNILQGDKVKDYTLPLNTFIHISMCYMNKDKIFHIYIDCEEVINFKINLDKVRSNTDLILGNGNLDAELTEIRIWNNVMPIGYLKENYKSPLPILAENKRKLKMRIHKQDDKTTSNQKKKFGFGEGQFVFGNKNNNSKFPKPELNNNNFDMNNNKNIYEFNPDNNNNTLNNSSVVLPSLGDVMANNNNNINDNNAAIMGVLNDNDEFPGFEKPKVENPYELNSNINDLNKGDNFDPTKFENFEMNDNFGGGFNFGNIDFNSNLNSNSNISDINSMNTFGNNANNNLNSQGNPGAINPYELGGDENEMKFKIDEINDQNFEFNMGGNDQNTFNFKFDEEDDKNQ